MKKILVPTDFSKTAEKGFVYALEMAKIYRAELLLMHTFDLPYVDNEVVTFNYTEIYDTLELSNSNQFEKELKRFKAIAKKQKAEDVRVSHILMNGDLIFNIKEVVRLENVDFVVMGTHGATNWFDSLIGTNTSNVISDISVPVLSVAHDTEFHKMQTIGFATCYREYEIHALKEVMAIAKKMHAKVKCVYVKTNESKLRGDEITKWESHFRGEKDLEFFIIPSEEIEFTIEEFIVNHGIDLLAMVTHKKGFFTQLFTTSTTRKMAQHSKTPILTIHE